MLKKKLALVLAMSMLLSVPTFADHTKTSPKYAPEYLAQVNTAEYQGVITEISNKQITVHSNLTTQGYETIVFNLSRETKFENCHLTELEVGNSIIVKHSLAMTRSAIPQAAALSVKLGTSLEQTFKYEGLVKEVVEDQNKNLLVLVASSNPLENNKEIRFVVSKDTKLINSKLSDLKAGTKVKLSYGMVMTMSLPPQTGALSLEIIKNTQKTYEFEGKITKVTSNGGNIYMTVSTKNTKALYKEMIFVVSSKTKFEDGKISDLKVGEEVEVKYGSAISESLPPQTAALSIEID